MPKGRVINIGVCGLGRAFMLMLPAFVNDPRTRLVAAFDPRQEARNRFARDFDAKAYDDVNKLMGDKAVDLVYIASPHQYHAEQTCKAARNGKHVLVEKPMALNPHDCQTMIETCKNAGVFLMVGHSHSFDTPYLRTQEIIRNKEFGNIKMILAFNYTDFLYRPRRAEELDAALGGGVVLNQASHQVDIIRLLADSPVTCVRSVVGSWDTKRSAEGAYTALLWFKSGAVATLTYSGHAHFDSDEWCGGTNEMGIQKDFNEYGIMRNSLERARNGESEAMLKLKRCYGSDDSDISELTGHQEETPLHQHFGPVIVSCEHADLRPLPDGIWVYSDMKKEKRTIDRPAFSRHEVIDELYAAIIENKTPLHDGVWAKSTLEVCLAIKESASRGCDIEL